MGAIGSLDVIPVLEKYLDDPSEAVSETCVLALDKIRYDNDPKNKEEREKNQSVYSSVDPAPPSVTVKSPQELGKQLMDTSLPLFERYRAMFGLREIGNTEAVEELAKGLKDKSGKFISSSHSIGQIFYVCDTRSKKIHTNSKIIDYSYYYYYITALFRHEGNKT